MADGSPQNSARGGLEEWCDSAALISKGGESNVEQEQDTGRTIGQKRKENSVDLQYWPYY